MASTTADRRQGVNSGAAVKVPCRCTTTANILLAGLQTIDGIALAAGDRVLVKDQTDPVENGIYVATTSTWQRDLDFDGRFDVKRGTLCLVNEGTVNGARSWRVTAADPVLPGTSAITFEQADVGSGLTQEMVEDIVAALVQAGTNMTIVYNDGVPSLVFSASASGGSTAANVQEAVQRSWFLSGGSA